MTKKFCCEECGCEIDEGEFICDDCSVEYDDSEYEEQEKFKMRENVDYKTNPEYLKLSEEDKLKFENYTKKIVNLTPSQKDKMTCLVAGVIALKATSDFSLKYDTIKKIIDLAFDAGQLNAFRTMMEETDKLGYMPSPMLMMIGHDMVISNFNKTRAHLINLVKELELKTDKVSTEEAAKGL